MAFQKAITLPSQVVLSYHVIEQIDLPVWRRNQGPGKGWTRGVISLARYVSKEAYEAGADPFDRVLTDITGYDFLGLNFTNDDTMLKSAYELIKDKWVDFGDADIVDVTPSQTPEDGTVR